MHINILIQIYVCYIYILHCKYIHKYTHTYILPSNAAEKVRDACVRGSVLPAFHLDACCCTSIPLKEKAWQQMT